jgi:hypothetical protein
MWGLNGEPLTVKRYTVKGSKVPKELAAFATDTLAALRKRTAPLVKAPDAGQ